MQLSIVMPAYNESGCIADSLKQVLDFCRRELSTWEVLVVDDGSTDDTVAIAETYKEVRVIQNEVNRGKGHSVKRGVLEANYDPVMFTDVDLSTPIDEARSLLDAIEGGVEVAVASRQYNADKTINRTPLRKLMAVVFRWCVKIIAARGIHDTQCGFKMFRRDPARKIFTLQRLDGWAFDVEILTIARRLGYKIAEVPVEWHEAVKSDVSFFSPFLMVCDLFRIRYNWLVGKYDSRTLDSRKD